MKISIAQQNYIVGDFEGNYQKIIHAIDEAVLQNADLVLFSELTVCGYPARDFLDYRDFTHKSLKTLNRIIEYSKDKIALVIGTPTFNPKLEGKDLFNSAVFIHEGKIQFTANKCLLPTYDIFDEYRYFESAKDFGIVEFKGYKIALTICEDIWDIDSSNPLYLMSPMEEISKFNPDIILNLSASPYSQGHTTLRKKIVQMNALKYNAAVFYCNSVGAQTDIIFDGASIVCNSKGELVQQLPSFEESIMTFDLSDVSKSQEEINYAQEEIALIHDALVLGIKDYFTKSGFKKAIVGLSGGVDSALVVALAAEALGAENVFSVLMPSQYSSDHSINDSLELVQNLGSQYEIVSIENAYQAFEQSLASHFEGLAPNVTEENLQSRIRGVILMAFSNKFGYILLNTSNKSEAAVGYGTLYGDMAGAIGVIGDLYKTQVYGLCQYINRNQIIIPENILTKPPSAELRPDQKDSDSLPDYDILDKILFEYIENCRSPQEIIALGFEESVVQRILSLVNRAEFKRYQTPPLLRVSSRAFGIGRRLPIVARYL
ncbi:MAG TPA: NAD+ synthase [Chitinophagales bacterium]|nr:NAD+ synthase [Chitinophagales bacterium]